MSDNSETSILLLKPVANLLSSQMWQIVVKYEGMLHCGKHDPIPAFFRHVALINESSERFLKESIIYIKISIANSNIVFMYDQM